VWSLVAVMMVARYEKKRYVNVSKVDGGREGRGERETVSSGRWIEDRQFGNGEKQTPWNVFLFWKRCWFARSDILLVMFHAVDAYDEVMQ